MDSSTTAAAWSQAARAGERLCAEHARSPFSHVYASPTCRTIETAGRIVDQLRGLSLVLVPGLAQCAAAVKKLGLTKFKPMAADLDGRSLAPSRSGKGPPRLARRPPPRFLTPDEVHARRSVPEGTSVSAEAVPAAVAEPGGGASFAPYDELFAGSVVRLARQHLGGRLLLVTHREGIAELLAAAGCPRKQQRSAYCAIARLRYEEEVVGADGGVGAPARLSLVSLPTTEGPIPAAAPTDGTAVVS